MPFINVQNPVFSVQVSCTEDRENYCCEDSMLVPRCASIFIDKMPWYWVTSLSNREEILGLFNALCQVPRNLVDLSQNLRHPNTPKKFYPMELLLKQVEYCIALASTKYESFPRPPVEDANPAYVIRSFTPPNNFVPMSFDRRNFLTSARHLHEDLTSYTEEKMRDVTGEEFTRMADSTHEFCLDLSKMCRLYLDVAEPCMKFIKSKGSLDWAKVDAMEERLVANLSELEHSIFNFKRAHAIEE